MKIKYEIVRIFIKPIKPIFVADGRESKVL